MHWSEVWEGEGLGPGLARLALTPVSWLYSAGWGAYLATYRLGLKRPAEPHAPVVCVGNLVVGGSGKSPVALYLARLLRDMGREVVLSCSGYGSPAAEGAQLAPAGSLDAERWGDEPAMFRLLAPELPLIVGRRRVRAAEICHERFPGAVMLMDDGFQHLPLRKHLTILLDPPRKNRRCLPAGPYREPRRNRSRADLVLPDRFCVHSETSFETPGIGRVPTPGRASVLCALGRPADFLEALGATGVRIEKVVLEPDHDPLQGGNLLRALPEETPVVVTAKDWVKLRVRSDVGKRNWIVAMQKVRIEPEDRFRDWLESGLHGFENDKGTPQ
jgi:tetraacyldisaccharide 4'-kinase